MKGVSLARPDGTSPKTRPDMSSGADNHNTSHPNLAGKCPDRPQFSQLFPDGASESAGILDKILFTNRNRLAKLPQKFQCDGYG